MPVTTAAPAPTTDHAPIRIPGITLTPDSEKRTVGDGDAARHVRTGCQVNCVANVAVVVDRSARVHDHPLSKAGERRSPRLRPA